MVRRVVSLWPRAISAMRGVGRHLQQFHHQQRHHYHIPADSRIERRFNVGQALYPWQRRLFSFEKPEKPDSETISVTFINKDGSEKTIQVPVGMSMLEAAHQNDIELEGACEGSLACSTCHVIVMDEDFYAKLPEPVDEENDMLDLAFGLTETSRLGCQVIAKPELDGIRLVLPVATRNFAVDGHVPKPH